MKVTQERLLNLMLKYNGGRPRSEAKLKSAVQLQDLLDATCMLVPCARSGKESSDSEADDLKYAEKLRWHVKAVLEEGGHFFGIYRKVQLKPQKWTKVPQEDDEVEDKRPIEALMVLKYGGVLTHAGRKQISKLSPALQKWAPMTYHELSECACYLIYNCSEFETQDKDIELTYLCTHCYSNI